VARKNQRQRRIRKCGILAMDAAQNAFDLGAVRIEILELVERGALVMLPAPSATPFRPRTNRHIAGSDDGSASRRQ
jgi:hypothetical protein